MIEMAVTMNWPYLCAHLYAVTLSRLQVRVKPGGSAPRHFFERAGLFKQGRRARNDLHLLLALELGVSPFIQLDDYLVAPAHDEQRRRLHQRQCRARKVWPPRDTTAPIFSPAAAAAKRAALAPVLAPK